MGTSNPDKLSPVPPPQVSVTHQRLAFVNVQYPTKMHTRHSSPVSRQQLTQRARELSKLLKHFSVVISCPPEPVLDALVMSQVFVKHFAFHSSMFISHTAKQGFYNSFYVTDGVSLRMTLCWGFWRIICVIYAMNIWTVYVTASPVYACYTNNILFKISLKYVSYATDKCSWAWYNSKSDTAM